MFLYLVTSAWSTVIILISLNDMEIVAPGIPVIILLLLLFSGLNFFMSTKKI